MIIDWILAGVKLGLILAFGLTSLLVTLAVFGFAVVLLASGLQRWRK